jgi:exonuclease III
MIHGLWGHKDVGWEAKESQGLSGGLLTIWNKELFVVRTSFFGIGFLGICVEWKDDLLYIINIYSPCTISGKRKLWQDLLDLKANSAPGHWCLGGDFNAVTTAGERRGSNGTCSQVERAEFGNFIDAIEVIDIPMAGKKFTWFNSEGTVMSRLDRFLLSESFIDKGGISNQWVGDRDISDHCPVWLICSKLNWGPKPF